MKDKYVEKQVSHYNQATSQAAKDNALYRAGTHLEVIPCDGNANLTDEKREKILKAINQCDEWL